MALRVGMEEERARQEGLAAQARTEAATGDSKDAEMSDAAAESTTASCQGRRKDQHHSTLTARPCSRPSKNGRTTITINSYCNCLEEVSIFYHRWYKELYVLGCLGFQPRLTLSFARTLYICISVRQSNSTGVFCVISTSFLYGEKDSRKRTRNYVLPQMVPKALPIGLFRVRVPLGYILLLPVHFTFQVFSSWNSVAKPTASFAKPIP